MKIRSGLFGVIIIGSLLLSGCSVFDSVIPELTEDEKAQVVEYASETLLLFDKKNGDKVGKQPEGFVSTTEVIVEGDESEVTELNPEEQTPVEEGLNLEIPDDDEGVGPEEVDIIDNTGSGESSFTSIDDALNISEAVAVSYDGYEIKPSYPDTLDAYFVMNASQGCKLLILKFGIKNDTPNNVEINMPELNLRFKIVLNGKTKNALTTMLLNDLAYYREVIPAGGSEELVVVGEYTDEELSSIESISLTVVGPEGNSNISLE